MSKLLIILLLSLSCATTNAVTGPQTNDTIVLEKSNTIVLKGEFKPEVINPLMQEFITKTSLNPQTDYYLYITSPGGIITLGLDFINLINSLPANVHTICNFCASMGFQTVQGVRGTRYILPHGTLMAHKARGGFQGEFPGQLESRLNYWVKRLKRMDELVAKRSKGIHTVKSFQALYENEYWCEGQECLKNGLVDKVIIPMCGKSLQGTTEENIKYKFLGQIFDVKITNSNCPLIIEPVAIEVSYKGKKIYRSKVPKQLKKFILKHTDPLYNFKVEKFGRNRVR